MSSDEKQTADSGADAREETKRKFREALEKKQQRETSREAHLDGESVVQATHGKAGTKREFRRKSG